ncbi:retrovirus-related pol polyprotein from transposon TNT 1-94 [Tanacetum coccineum]
MNSAQLLREFKSICDGSNLGKNLERSNISGVQLSPFTKTYHPFPWGHFQHDLISYLKLKGVLSYICVALLTITGSLYTTLDLNDLLSCLVDDLYASELAISNFSPSDSNGKCLSQPFPNRAHMHATCPATSEWSSHFDHRSASDRLYSYPVKYLVLCEETSKNTALSTSPLSRLLSWVGNEQTWNFKVHEMIIKKDSEIVKEKVIRKSLALKAKKESSDKECLTSGSEDEEYAMAVRDFKKFFKRRGRFVRQSRNDKKTFQRSRDDKNGKSNRKCFRCGDPNHLIGECAKPPKDKNQRAFVEGSWSDSGEEDDKKVKNETCLVAQASSEVCSESFYFSDENSLIDDLVLDNEYDKLCKMSLKIITKNKRLKANRNSLEKELNILKEKVSTLEKNKGLDLEYVKCHMLKIENEKLKKEALKLIKFKKSTHCLNEMLSNQKPSGDKFGLGFNSFEASSSRTKEIKFVKAQKKASSDGGPINMGGPLSMQAAPKAIIGPPPVATPGYEKRNKPKDQICLATIDENSMLWHRRLGHVNMRLIQSLASKELVRNLPKLKFDQHFCDACKIGKQAHASHKAKNIVLTTRCLELLHMDLFGPSAVRSYGGNRYTLVIVDDYSRYTWTRFLKDKTEAFDQFKIFSKKIQNQLGCTIVSIRTDHGREFDNEVQFGEFCNANGITHNFSAPRTPQSNGVVERKNRTLQEMSRTMLNEQSLPQKFWCNAVEETLQVYILKPNPN